MPATSAGMTVEIVAQSKWKARWFYCVANSALIPRSFAKRRVSKDGHTTEFAAILRDGRFRQPPQTV
jgi:hypothetical protein